MIDRVKVNEDRLNESLLSIKELDRALKQFKSNKKNVDLVNKYYGSKGWFKDRDIFEKENITDVRCGVLSEDSVWNMNEDIKDLIVDMEEIIKIYSK